MLELRQSTGVEPHAKTKLLKCGRHLYIRTPEGVEKACTGSKAAEKTVKTVLRFLMISTADVWVKVFYGTERFLPFSPVVFLCAGPIPKELGARVSWRRINSNGS